MELQAEIRVAAGRPALRDGWRGLADFGEVVSPADADLYPGNAAPIGKPLLYGCQVNFVEKGSSRVVLTFWAIDSPRPVMQPAAEFSLKDGPTHIRATGRVVSAA
jgi:hypothetical protein